MVQNIERVYLFKKFFITISTLWIAHLLTFKTSNRKVRWFKVTVTEEEGDGM